MPSSKKLVYLTVSGFAAAVFASVMLVGTPGLAGLSTSGVGYQSQALSDGVVTVEEMLFAGDNYLDCLESDSDFDGSLSFSPSTHSLVWSFRFAQPRDVDSFLRTPTAVECRALYLSEVEPIHGEQYGPVPETAADSGQFFGELIACLDNVNSIAEADRLAEQEPHAVASCYDRVYANRMLNLPAES